MDSEIIKEFEKMLSDKLPNQQFSDEAVANVTRVFHDAIKQKDEEYRAAREVREKEHAQAEEANVSLLADVEQLKEELSSTQTELSSMKEEREAAVAQETFNSRMAGLDKEFSLESEDREILAVEVQELETSPEAFASYQEKIRVMWAHKAKSFLEAKETELQDRIDAEVTKRVEAMATAPSSKTTEVTEAAEAEEVLDAASEESSELLTNNNAESSVSEPSLRDRFREAFSKDNLTIKI